MKDTRLTTRGWAVLVVVALVAAFVLGLVTGPYNLVYTASGVHVEQNGAAR